MSVEIFSNSKKNGAVDLTMKPRKVGSYTCVPTKTTGVFKVVEEGKSGYVAVLDYGKRYIIDQKTGKRELKPYRTRKHAQSFEEAVQLRAEADRERYNKKRGIVSDVIHHNKCNPKFSDLIEDFKRSQRYLELALSNRVHYDNYMKHMIDYFGDTEPKNITVVDIENYFIYQRDRGNLASAKRNKDGSISKKEGISINTLAKHKSALKRIFQFAVDMKENRVYGLTENIVSRARIPKATIEVGGMQVVVSKIPFNARPLTMEELNYTLNDAIENEFDRSIALSIALASIGSLRHSEVVGLQVGGVAHNKELFSVPDGIFDYGNFDKEYYFSQGNLMMIWRAIMRYGGEDYLKLPKEERVRICGMPECLQKIILFALEQRKEVYDVIGKKITGDEPLYLPLYQSISGKTFSSQKLSRRFNEYQDRRTKRMLTLGLEPIPHIRFQDLRHTHATLIQYDCAYNICSYNMGHSIPGEMMEIPNTTTKVYKHDRQPRRGDIIRFFDENIKIDWSKAMNKHINSTDSRARIDGSGHIIVGEHEKARIRELKKKCILSEDEYIELIKG